MKQYTMDQRYALLAEWKQSGKSVNQFCRDKKLKTTTFHGWRKRYNRKRPSLIEILEKMPLISEIGSSLELQWKSYRIKLNRNFDTVTLKRLLQTLEQYND